MFNTRQMFRKLHGGVEYSSGHSPPPERPEVVGDDVALHADNCCGGDRPSRHLLCHWAHCNRSFKGLFVPTETTFGVVRIFSASQSFVPRQRMRECQCGGCKGAQVEKPVRQNANGEDLWVGLPRVGDTGNERVYPNGEGKRTRAS
jgi:hypothetical protein